MLGRSLLVVLAALELVSQSSAETERAGSNSSTLDDGRPFSLPVRLVGGGTTLEGRVEVRYGCVVSCDIGVLWTQGPPAATKIGPDQKTSLKTY